MARERLLSPFSFSPRAQARGSFPTRRARDRSPSREARRGSSIIKYIPNKKSQKPLDTREKICYTIPWINAVMKRVTQGALAESRRSVQDGSKPFAKNTSELAEENDVRIAVEPHVDRVKI